MADHNDDFRELVRRIQEGSEDAACELVQRYGAAIRGAVRRALDKRLRSRFDSLDFVQLVWSSFFRVRDKVDRFNRPEELVAFLVVMARNKVGMEARRLLSTEKYNLNRECSLDELGTSAEEGISGREPSPIEVAMANEQWSRMVQDQPEHYRQIIRLRLRGHTYREIADSVRLDKSTVRRFFKRLFHERVV